MDQELRTNAESSGLELDRKALKSLSRRSDRPGLIWLAKWLVLMAITGYLLHLSMDSYWLVPTLLVYSLVLVLPMYCMSHECAHGTAFRSRWLNETLFWISSLVYIEEPLYRRYAHASHHTYTSIVGKDGQIGLGLAFTLPAWLWQISGLGQYVYEAKVLLRNACGWFDAETQRFTPESELPRLRRNAQIFLLIYVGGGIAAWYFAAVWVWWYLVLPRLVGAPLMIQVTLTQHAESELNVYDLRETTRSLRTNKLGEFLYMNMNYHIEHHAHSGVPFFALPELNQHLRDRLPTPDPGMVRTGLEMFWAVSKRSLGLNSRAATIRQGLSILKN